MPRGAFFVFEGLDRSGKTTICKNIVDALNKMKIKAEYMNFPNRDTIVGKIIDDYLCKRVELNDKTVHLLFAANRWELDHEIRGKLQSGLTIIVDRYSYSGIAYSAIKPGMDIDWCKNPESGLPKPDVVFYLDLPFEEIARRGGFGAERYEKKAIQEQVAEIFKQLQTSSWKVIDAKKEEDELQNELLPIITETLKSVEDFPVKDLCGEELKKTCNCPPVKWGDKSELRAARKAAEDAVKDTPIKEEPAEKVEKVEIKKEENQTS